VKQHSELPGRFRHTRVFDLSKFYSAFVPFTVNSIYPIHRWYRFKEGYSKDLVHLILGSLGIRVNDCLDPFGGSGTTALACQETGIRCHSIEVNPFLWHLAKSKLSTRYTLSGFDDALESVKRNLIRRIDDDYEEPIMSTLTERSGLDKWLFSRSVLQAVLALRHCFASVHPLYSNLLLVALASILTDVGNTIKDGKCVRYKKNWRKLAFTRQDVADLFLERVNLFREDRKLPDNYVDAVITSPPYLNSFDYTDVYMPELWALGFINSYEESRRLRRATFCSHVQVTWKKDEARLNDSLKALVAEIVGDGNGLWNSIIPKMIAGYFLDMQAVLKELKRIVRPHGKVCIVVGTSSYSKVTVPTDLLLAGLAEDTGFRFEEIRIVRRLNKSTQQANVNGVTQPGLRESMLIFGVS
jgi:DNA modification methylase